MDKAKKLAKWFFVVAFGIILWLLGLTALDVPASLPMWRHASGASLMVIAVHIWQKACNL